MRTKKISSEEDNNKALSKVLDLMNKGSENLTDADYEKIRVQALAIQAYEKRTYKIPEPSTIEGMVELRMYEMKLKQKQAAKLMGITEPKLSQIITGKRKPDVAFLKAAREKLNIDADFLLEHA